MAALYQSKNRGQLLPSFVSTGFPDSATRDFITGPAAIAKILIAIAVVGLLSTLNTLFIGGNSREEKFP